MNKLIKTLLLASLFLFGCEQGIDVNSPPQPTANLRLISLPTPTGGLSVETIYTQDKTINGYYGGNFFAQFSYQGGPNGTVNIYSKLQFPSGAFSGYTNITQTFNTETAALTFGPSMQFNQTVLYDLTITGIDLTGVNPNTLAFVYIANDGSIQNCVYEDIWMDTSTGTLHVEDAELHHFSRYGFVN
jgi:hypothetical protein